MSQGKGKASSSRRRSSDGLSYDDRPRLAQSSASSSHTSSSEPSSSFDSSIPLNLPPRRSMKMLKDGSDFVWPDSAHSLFVRGLQAWKFMNIGNKRTRAPRGEGKTDFLVRYLQSHGVERTKKQVASHLQVLRTEWRNSDNTLLLSLVDDTASHSRSLSEPSLPPQSPSNSSSPSISLSLFNSSSDRIGDDRATSTPSLPPPISTLPPQQPPTATTSSLFHPAHNVYGVRPQPEPYPDSSMPDGNIAYRSLPSSSSVGSSWHIDDTVWRTPVDRFPTHQQPEPERFPSQQSEPYARQPLPYTVANYDTQPSSFRHDYDRTPRPVVPSSLEQRGFSSDYYSLSGRGDSSSSVAPSQPHSFPLPLEAGNHPTGRMISAPTSYNSYNINTSSSYSIANPTPQQSAPQDVYGTASTSYGDEPYQTHFSGEPQPQPQPHSSPPHAASGIAGSASSYDVVEPDFLGGAHHHHHSQHEHEQLHGVQPQWIRPPATFPRAPDAPERHDGSPEP